ncbi:MAG: sugar phosphate isomerase/epimerase [Prolixibacteraceae bacterium]|nr:sugar phosphate isomerase/epimerase [Prolixibacteraceae bacterium]
MNKLGIFINLWERNWDVDHIKYIKKVAAIGYDILEFQAQPLLEMSYTRMDEIKSCASDHNIELTYSLGLDPQYDVSSSDATIRQGGIEYLQRIVERVGYMDGKIISGVSYGGWGISAGTAYNKIDMVNRSLNSMRKIVKTAENYGVQYCVECVNRFESPILNTAQEALDYVAQIESDNIGILLDTYHMNIEEISIGDAIRLVNNKLLNFHTGENNRSIPGMGMGHLNWDEIFSALKDISYKGRIISEPFVAMGGEVGRDIHVWRNLIEPTEENLDRGAEILLNFEKQMLIKYRM